MLVERNSFTSPVKDRFLALTNIKSKFPPPLQSAFARYFRVTVGFLSFCLLNNLGICILLLSVNLLNFNSPTRPNPGGGGETCAETSINVFFGKVKLSIIPSVFMLIMLCQSLFEVVITFLSCSNAHMLVSHLVPEVLLWVLNFQLLFGKELTSL